MKKSLVVILMVIAIIFNQFAFANEISGSSLVDLANNELEMANLIDEPYFHSERNTRGKPLSINQYLTGERNLIVYGDPHGYDSETGRNRYLGYTMSNAPFTNYLFRNDATSSVGLWNRNWVPNPKYNSKTMDRPEVQGEDNFNNLIRYKESIKLGLQHISRKKPDGTLLDFPEDKIDDRQWHRYVHVYQPPTSVSWGSGIMFHTTSEGKVWYLTVPMSPEGIPKPEDLEANFNPLPSSAAKGTDTLIGVNIESTFKQDLQDIPFQWEVTKANGTPLNATDDSLEFKVGSTVYNAAGTINIPAIRKEATLYVSFKMPDSGVKIKFKVNETRNQPKETNVTNNIIEAEVRPIESITITNQPYDLPYNVLSKRLQFPLANGREITADLHLPNGSWISNAVGSLDVENETPSLFRYFSVENNPPVNEPSSRIIRTPVINTTIERKDFGDDPQNRNWLNWAKPLTPKIGRGDISFEGSVRRSYEYYHENDDCPGHIGTTTAAFNSGTDTSIYGTYIYNGLENMPPVASRNFKRVVERNQGTSFERDLFWISDPYRFDVIRWMTHLDENNREYNWTKVDGQYERIFTQQNTADIKWAVKEGMKDIYQSDRDNAREKKQGKSDYPNVVFPTDKEFRGVEYPFKSEYYFNPRGEYTATVKTVQYKNSADDTDEHRELVDKVKNAFYYKSDLLYTRDGRNGQSLYITNQNSDVFGIDMLNIQTNTDKDVEILEHTTDSDGETHKFFKEILEGYSESNTLDSKTNFKYREYIKSGNIYKVTETTVIIFKVASSAGQKLYTFANMKNGNYVINVGVNRFSLDNYRYDGLNVNKVESLENITVKVKGSMYDDLNN